MASTSIRIRSTHVPCGYFYEAGLPRHEWAAKSKPHVDFDVFKKRLSARKKSDDSNPIWQRKYLEKASE